jgi:hypothetical protein
MQELLSEGAVKAEFGGNIVRSAATCKWALQPDEFPYTGNCNTFVVFFGDCPNFFRILILCTNIFFLRIKSKSGFGEIIATSSNVLKTDTATPYLAVKQNDEGTILVKTSYKIYTYL